MPVLDCRKLLCSDVCSCSNGCAYGGRTSDTTQGEDDEDAHSEQTEPGYAFLFADGIVGVTCPSEHHQLALLSKTTAHAVFDHYQDVLGITWPNIRVDLVAADST